jgi:hypothetical protein
MAPTTTSCGRGIRAAPVRVVALERWAELNVARQLELRCDGGCGLGSLAGELAGTDAETRADLAAGFTQWEALLRGGL